MNALSVEETHLRTDLLPGLVTSVERNWGAMERDVRLFEIGTVFHREDGRRLPRETVRLAAVITGASRPGHWSEAGGVAPDWDLWDIKALFGAVVAAAGSGGRIEAAERGWELTDDAGVRCGWGGVLSADGPAWAGALFGLEVDLQVRARIAVQYKELPTTPAVERDLALEIPSSATAAEIESVIRETTGALLASLHIFDEYRGEGVRGRSIAWRLVFRSPGRTLRDQDADGAVERVMAVLKERYDIKRR